MADRHDDHARAGQEDAQRAEPQQPGAGFERRLVQHEIGIARHQVLLDLVVALALLHQLEHFQAQVAGEVGVGVGKVLVLADQAAQLLGEVLEAQLLRVVLERQRFDRAAGGEGGAGKRQQHHQQGA